MNESPRSTTASFAILLVLFFGGGFTGEQLALALVQTRSHDHFHQGARMIESDLDTAHAILYVRPMAALEKADFLRLAEKVDPYLEASGALRGLVIEAPTFPGWENFGALAAHFRFVRDHHKRIEKVAVVTDSALGSVAEHLASHFVSAEIRRFAAGELEAARQWVMARA